jgi:hypothetical protein
MKLKAEFVCELCGVTFPNTTNAPRRKYCPTCASMTAYGANHLPKNVMAKIKKQCHPTCAASGVFAGKQLWEIEQMAREHGMSYGQFRAQCESLGYIPKKED